MAELRTYAVPSNLFRYRSLGQNTRREVTALEGNFVYCPHFSAMNDPMEGTHRLSLRLLTSTTNASAQQQVLESQQTMGIASFSEVFDHEPMWAHYAGQFSGICIQYNTRRLLKGLADDVDLARMMYSEKAPVILEERQSPEDRAKLTLSSKTVRWASEREWRIFRPLAGPASYRDPDTVTRIYLGARIAEEDEAVVRAFAKQNRIPVLAMTIDAYTLQFNTAKRPLSPKTADALKRLRQS